MGLYGPADDFKPQGLCLYSSSEPSAWHIQLWVSLTQWAQWATSPSQNLRKVGSSGRSSRRWAPSRTSRRWAPSRRWATSPSRRWGSWGSSLSPRSF